MGKDYEYTDLVRLGEVDCNNFKEREIKKVDFKSFFLLDKNNLSLQEIRYRLRKREHVKLEEIYTKEQIEAAEELERQMKEREEEEKKKREEEAKARHNKINSFLNNLISFGDEEEEAEGSDKSDIMIIPEEEEEESLPYENLNPFSILKK